MLTKRQAEVLGFIKQYTKANGYAPSFQEIADAVGAKSKSNIHYCVRQLEDRGQIRRLPGRARAIEVL